LRNRAVRYVGCVGRRSVPTWLSSNILRWVGIGGRAGRGGRVIIVHSPSTGSTLNISTGIRMLASGRWGRGCGQMCLTFITISIHINMISLDSAGERLRLVKGWKAGFGLLLSSLAICLGFDSVQAHLLGVIFVGSTLWIVPRSPFASFSSRNSWSFLNATSAEGVETSTEK